MKGDVSVSIGAVDAHEHWDGGVNSSDCLSGMRDVISGKGPLGGKVIGFARLGNLDDEVIRMTKGFARKERAFKKIV